MSVIDPRYLDAIKRLEGFTPQAQWDYRQNSNGYGTKALYPGEVIDKETAEQRFLGEITNAAGYVDKIAPNAPPGVKAALTSLTYNAGPGWMNAGLGELVKAGDYQGASQRLQEYNKAGGQVLPGLQSRRAEEASWFNASGAPQSEQPAPMAAYPWTPGQQQQPQAAQPVGQSQSIAPPEQTAQPAPQQMASYMPQQRAPTFEELGKVLGLSDPPPLQFPQPSFRGPKLGPPSFRRV